MAGIVADEPPSLTSGATLGTRCNNHSIGFETCGVRAGPYDFFPLNSPLVGVDMRVVHPRVISRGVVRAAIVAGALVLGASVGRTSAAFTATAPITGGATSGVVALSTGGVQQLTFGGATLTNIGPGATFSQTVTVLNQSTVTTPSALTDIALWGDITGTSSAATGLGAALQVTIVRSVGGESAETLYSGALTGLAAYSTFSTPIGTLWSSRNGGPTTGASAKSATYTFTFTLPASATTGADSSVAVTFTFEARNKTQ